MTLYRTVAPASEAVSVADIKALIRVDVTDDDTVIGDLRDQAVAELDGRDGLLGRALITQTWELRLPAFPVGNCIRIPLPPLQSVASIAYLDRDGNSQTMPATDYVVDTKPEPGMVYLATGKTWPTGVLAGGGRDVVTVTFVAGYGADTSSIPAPITTWLKNRAGLLYQMRETPPAARLGGLANWRIAMVA